MLLREKFKKNLSRIPLREDTIKMMLTIKHENDKINIFCAIFDSCVNFLPLTRLEEEKYLLCVRLSSTMSHHSIGEYF